MRRAATRLVVSFRQACVVVTTELTLESLAAKAHGCEHPVDLVNRKGLGIKIIADPVAHFFVPFVVGVVEGLYKVVESGDASIAKIIRVDGLGADPPQYAGEAGA